MIAPPLLLGPGPPKPTELTAEWFAPAPTDGDRDEAVRAVAAALASPIGLPSLDACVTPDDRVAIAVAEETPRAADLVAGVIAALVGCGVDPSHVTVVAANRSDLLRLEAGLAHESEAGVAIEMHDADNEDALCFAGMTRTEKALLANRRLFEADFILPIAAYPNASPTDDGAYSGVFPDFFDRKTIDRVRRVSTVRASLSGGARAAARRRESDEAGWLLGVPLAVIAVAGPDRSLTAVTAGEPNAVADGARAIADRTWRQSGADPADLVADLVIVKLGGSPDEQSWSAVGRALAVAERLVAPDGLVAVWTELDHAVGQSLGRLVDEEDRDRVGAELEKDAGGEAWAAWRLLQSLERGPVFFRGRLPAETVEDLGLAPVTDAEQLVRLAERYESCLLLEDAQHVSLGEDDSIGGTSPQDRTE